MRLSGLKRKTLLIPLIFILLLPVVFAACGGSDTYERDRNVQESIMSKGQSAAPIYETENFLARKAINEYMERMDTPNKLWYVYLMSESGAYIGYHILRTYPISIAVAMSSPMQIITWVEGTVTIPAPGIDAVYYNGVDPTLYYGFDAETNAMVMWTTEFVAYDAPLDLNVPLLRIKVTE